MNSTIPNPGGIDRNIQTAQTRLYDYLLQRWSISGTPDKYLSYGRVYRNNTNTKEGGFIPEAWNPDIKDYVGSSGRGSNGGLFFEDKLAVLSYWDMYDPIKKNANRDDVATVDLLFFVDLSKITPGGISAAAQRLDEIAVNDVKNFIQNSGCGFTVSDTIRGVDKVLERYSGLLKKNALNDDMNPRFCFKLKLEIRYNPQIFTSPAPPRQLNPMDRNIILFIKSSPDLTKKIAVGNGQFIYQEYAPGNTLTPLLFGTTTPYLAYKNVQLLMWNNQTDLLATYNTTTGVWDRTGQGLPYGFNNTDFVGILFTDLT